MSRLGPGERALSTLLASIKPTLNPETFVFLTLGPANLPPPSLRVQMLFQEAEGITVITTQASASTHNLDHVFPCRMITLNVHSSLEAVGFIAVVAARLKEKQMGANPVSGYFHDHLFVPLGREDEAMQVLHDLAAQSIQEGTQE